MCTKLKAKIDVQFSFLFSWEKIELLRNMRWRYICHLQGYQVGTIDEYDDNESYSR